MSAEANSQLRISQNYFSALARGGLSAAISISNSQSPKQNNNALKNQGQTNNPQYYVGQQPRKNSLDRQSRQSDSKTNQKPTIQELKDHYFYQSQNQKKLLSLMSGSDLQPLEEEVSKEEDESMVLRGSKPHFSAVEKHSFSSQPIASKVSEGKTIKQESSQIIVEQINSKGNSEADTVNNSNRTLSKGNSSASYISGDCNYNFIMEESNYNEILQKVDEKIAAKIFDPRLQQQASNEIKDQKQLAPKEDAKELDYNEKQKAKAKMIIDQLKSQAKKPNTYQSQPPIEQRLFDYQKKVEEKLEYQRKQKELQELEQLRSIPQISDKTNEILMRKSVLLQNQQSFNLNPRTQTQVSPVKNNHSPNNRIQKLFPSNLNSHNKSNIVQFQNSTQFDPKSYFEEQKRKEDTRQQILQEKEMEGFTGKPQINKKSQSIKRKLYDLMEWKDIQDKKRNEEFVKKLEQEQKLIQELQSHRVVSKQSEKLVETKYRQSRAHERVEDRLLRDASLRQNKQKKQQLNQIFQISELNSKDNIRQGRSKTRSRSQNQRLGSSQKVQHSPLNFKGQQDLFVSNKDPRFYSQSYEQPIHAPQQQLQYLSLGDQSNFNNQTFSPSNNIYQQMISQSYQSNQQEPQRTSFQQQPMQYAHIPQTSQNLFQTQYNQMIYSQQFQGTPSELRNQQMHQQLKLSPTQFYQYSAKAAQRQSGQKPQQQISFFDYSQSNQSQSQQQNNLLASSINHSQLGTFSSENQTPNTISTQNKAQNIFQQTINTQSSHQKQQQQQIQGKPAKKAVVYESLFDKLQRMNTSQNHSQDHESSRSSGQPVISAQSPFNLEQAIQQKNIAPVTNFQIQEQPIMQNVFSYNPQQQSYDYQQQQQQIMFYNPQQQLIPPQQIFNDMQNQQLQPLLYKDQYHQPQQDQERLQYLVQNFDYFTRSLSSTEHHQDQIIHKILENSFIPSGSANQTRRSSTRNEVQAGAASLPSQENSLTSNLLLISNEKQPLMDRTNQSSSRNDQGPVLETQFITNVTQNSQEQQQNFASQIQNHPYKSQDKAQYSRTSWEQHNKKREQQNKSNSNRNSSRNREQNQNNGQNFIERINKWQEEKKNRLEKAKKISTLKTERECPFKPHIFGERSSLSSKNASSQRSKSNFRDQSKTNNSSAQQSSMDLYKNIQVNFEGEILQESSKQTFQEKNFRQSLQLQSPSSQERQSLFNTQKSNFTKESKLQIQSQVQEYMNHNSVQSLTNRNDKLIPKVQEQNHNISGECDISNLSSNQKDKNGIDIDPDPSFISIGDSDIDEKQPIVYKKHNIELKTFNKKQLQF